MLKAFWFKIVKKILVYSLVMIYSGIVHWSVKKFTGKVHYRFYIKVSTSHYFVSCFGIILDKVYVSRYSHRPPPLGTC